MAEIADELRERARTRAATSKPFPPDTFIEWRTADALDAKDKRIAELEAGRWQPIETAPKDGSQIFIGIGARMIIARWMADDFYSSVDGGTISVGPNTLWHAFPAPPSLLNKEDRNG